MDDVEIAKRIFPPSPSEGTSIWSLAQGTLEPQIAGHLKDVRTWPDLLALPDDALGLDRFYGRRNAAVVTHGLDIVDFARFLPGWLLLARDRSFNLGAFSTIIARIHPQGVLAQIKNEDGRSELETMIAALNNTQRRWIADIVGQILQLCRGSIINDLTTVEEAFAYWASVSELTEER